jgi:hypothetical protein
MALLDDALTACGGLDQWQKLESFTLHLSITGALLGRNGKAGMLKEIVVEGSTREPLLRIEGFTAPDKRAVYRPSCVAVENRHGHIFQERHYPHKEALELPLLTPWDDLTIAYFCGSLIWHNIAAPFVLAGPAFQLNELSSWQEGAESWRRLRAIFPFPYLAPFNDQMIYFDRGGLRRRVDVQMAHNVGTAIALFLRAHQSFSRIVIPTLWESLRLWPDGGPYAKRPLLTVEIFDAHFG